MGIEVWLFDDRMEVTSPGGLLLELSLDELLSLRRVHCSRNPRLMRTLVDRRATTPWHHGFALPHPPIGGSKCWIGGSRARIGGSNLRIGGRGWTPGCGISSLSLANARASRRSEP